MSGFPFPTSTHKWMGVPEAKHPFIQDLIKIWEESPGYILPQQSFIKDKAKLEALIDGFIDMQKQKAAMPARSAPRAVPSAAAAAATHTASGHVAPEGAADAKPADDKAWERNLASALALTKVTPIKKADGVLPAIPAMPDLSKIPGAQEKLAELNLGESASSLISPLSANALELPMKGLSQAQGQSPLRRETSIHILILYSISLCAFILALYALKTR